MPPVRRRAAILLLTILTVAFVMPAWALGGCIHDIPATHADHRASADTSDCHAAAPSSPDCGAHCSGIMQCLALCLGTGLTASAAMLERVSSAQAVADAITSVPVTRTIPPEQHPPRGTAA